MPAQNSSALDVVSRRYRSALISFFNRRIRDRAEAEDLTQEAFLRLASTSKTPDDAGAYVFQVAANLLRDRTRRWDVRSSYLQAVAAETPLHEDRDPARTLIGRESLADVLAALHELSPRTREVFLLVRLEHMRQREVADLFGISVSAVEKHVVKASVQISRRLGESS